MNTHQNKKTNFRWIIITLLFILNIISYIDRSAMSYAVNDIMASLHLSFTEMGSILGAFGVGYLITTFLGGIIVDRQGARIVLLIFSLIWTIAIGATGLTVGFISAYVARFFLGFGEGPNFPAVARTVSDWLPEQARAKALANALIAVPVSLAIGSLIVSLLLANMNWRWMFIILALMLIVWWPLWWFFYADKPKQSKYVNQAELEYIERTDSTPAAEQEQIKTPWRFFFKNPTVLANNWGFFVYGFSMMFYLSWMPEFLEKTYHLNIKQVGSFTFLPWILGAVFLWLGGYISDYIYKKTAKLRYARTYPIIAGQLLNLLCIIPLLIWHDLTTTILAISFAVAFNLSNNTTFYSTNIDVARHRSASSLGLMNAGFAIAGFISPMITGWLVQTTNSFYSAFYLIIALSISSIIILYFFHQPDK